MINQHLLSLPYKQTKKGLLVLSMVISAIYLSWWFYPHHIGNIYLYSLLLIGELYHILMAATFWHTIWPRENRTPLQTLSPSFRPTVDIFIPVAGEPVEVIAETIKAAKAMAYEKQTIYILNDSFVAGKDNWSHIEDLANSLGVHCITRKKPGGAKAGNLNNALAQTHGEIVVIFDSDMKPEKEFLSLMLPYFQDPKVGFVQSPQYYENFSENHVTGGAWEQQELFFGPIMQGKDTTNSAFICGTNVALRRTALLQAGGMCETNIAEDFITSLTIHQQGWKSHYVPYVLAKGLAPADLLSYYKQQLRWARGSLEVLFTFNPLFKRGLSRAQKVEYLSSGLYYLNGIIVLIDILMPLIFFFTGAQPVAATTTSFALFFIPFICLALYNLYAISDGSVTFRSMSYSMASFTLQLRALASVILHQKMEFAVTSKKAQTGNFLFLAYPHILYIILVIIGFLVSVHRSGTNPAVITNLAWALFNVSMFLPFIHASFALQTSPTKIQNLAKI